MVIKTQILDVTTILRDRLGGSIEEGECYGIGFPLPDKALLPWAWLVAPIPVEMASARTQEIVAIGNTLRGGAGIICPDPYLTVVGMAGLPPLGLADQWGEAYYKSPIDVATETRLKGPCRRMSPSVIKMCSRLPLPIPVLVTHKLASMTRLDTVCVCEWLTRRDIMWQSFVETRGHTIWDVYDEPWILAESLGRAGDDTFDWHPYIAMYRVLEYLKGAKLYNDFINDCRITFETAIFGLTWITSFVWVVPQDQAEEDMPEELKELGVLPAYSPHRTAGG